MRGNDMEAFVLHGAKDLRRAQREKPSPGPSDVLIDVKQTGICGSDIHYYARGQIGDFIPKEPFALGHEVAGAVTAVGNEVEQLHEGDFVSVDPQIPCGRCSFCRQGRYNLCSNMRFIGSASCYPHIDGGFAQYVSVPGTSCHRMPTSVSREVAALMEPLSVATHAVRRAHAALDSPGKLGGIAGADVLITGGGTIGQLVIMVARAYGARKITVSDPVAFRRRMALESGADSAVDPGDEDAAGALRQEGAEGFEIAFEASGVPEALTTCYRGARRGATVVQVGTQPHGVAVATNLVMSKELAVVGSFRFVHVSDAVLSLLQSDTVPLRSIVTSVYGFDETQQAMETALKGEDTLKVQIAQ